MESAFVRGFVLFIALIGFGATTSNTGHQKSQDEIIGGGAPPSCLPGTGNYCGMQ